jgi:hypothetical protein
VTAASAAEPLAFFFEPSQPEIVRHIIAKATVRIGTYIALPRRE